MSAEVTGVGIFDMQVCVPEDWIDDEVKDFADIINPCGTKAGWFIRKQVDECLSGDDERVKCEERDGHVHIMLDA